jgi:NADPH2:quinone reductase
MRAVGYSEIGEPDVLQMHTLEAMPQPTSEEVCVRIVRSGVNPTDWKSRRGALHMPIPAHQYQVPHHDGAGVIVSVGSGVDRYRVGQRVWVWQAAYRRLGGTAQEFVALPLSRVEPLPNEVSFDTGASLGIPYMTAHRALAVCEGATERLAPGALNGRVVLVAGGAGAVGHAAIQLAQWAGATVITTVSSQEKQKLARAAGATHVINYKDEDVVQRVHDIAPAGIDIVVEVSSVANTPLIKNVLKPNGVISIYANDGGNELVIPVREWMTLNARFQFILVYTMTESAKRNAADAIGEALRDGAIGTGDVRGMPLHHYPLDAVQKAHQRLEAGALIGRVMVDVAQGV